MSRHRRHVHVVWHAEGDPRTTGFAEEIAPETAACAPDLTFALFPDADRYPGTDTEPAATGSAADAVVVLAPARLRERCDLHALLHRTRARFSAGVPVAALILDDPEEFDTNYLLPALFDAVFTDDANAALYYHSERVYALPPAARATATATTDDTFDCDVLVCRGGDHTGEEESLLRAVRAAAPENARIRVVEDETPPVEICRRAKVVLRYPDFRAGAPGNRLLQVVRSTPDAQTFRLAEAGIFQLVFLRQPELLDLFSPDEIPAFSREADLRESLGRTLSDEAFRADAAARARARVHREHLYRHRLRTLADTLFGEEGQAIR